MLKSHHAIIYVMNALVLITNIFVLSLAMWKIHDILNMGRNAKRVKELQQERAKQELMLKFYAELIYKFMDKKEDYMPAPQYIYDWINLRYREWLTFNLEQSSDKLNNKN